MAVTIAQALIIFYGATESLIHVAPVTLVEVLGARLSIAASRVR